MSSADVTGRPVAPGTDESLTALLDGLGRWGWHVLHGVGRPGWDHARLDHVLVGPGGVVVVDAPGWGARVVVERGVLRAGRHRRDADVDDALRQGADVCALLPARFRRTVSSVLCFGGAHPEVHSVRGVTVCSQGELVEHLRGLPVVLGRHEVGVLAAQLRHQLARSRPGSGPAPRPGGGGTHGTHGTRRTDETDESDESDETDESDGADETRHGAPVLGTRRNRLPLVVLAAAATGAASGALAGATWLPGLLGLVGLGGP